MFKLFNPQTKAQKDRVILRETDMRMAKYSRRGIITNFLIYSACLLIEQNFIRDHQLLALVLTIGLLLTTLLRAYLLFRIEAIYPRGPAAWRNRYFLATLLGAGWWSLILSTLTLARQMQGEAALLWLYTVVFFATTAHAFAPYSNFCRSYQLIALIPASLCTFMIGDLVGVFYGAVLLFFSYLLAHHSQLMSENYWERLDAQQSLVRKTESLEEEKRDTRASVQLINQYMDLLSAKMRALLKETETPGEPATGAKSAIKRDLQRQQFARVYENVDEFQRVLNKDIEVNPRIFNVRHYLQGLIKDKVETAERQSIELEIALSPALPARLKGDAGRLGQIVDTMVASALSQFEGGLLFVEIEFLREYESSGELLVSIAHQAPIEKKTFFQSPSTIVLEMNLELMLAKALVHKLNGELEVNEATREDSKCLRLRLPLALAEVDVRSDYHRLEYKRRPILLVHNNPYWLDHKRLELDSMGFAVHTASSYKKALQSLNDSVSSGKLIPNLVFYSAAGDTHAVQFSQELLGHNDFKHINQFVIASGIGRHYFEERIGQNTSMVYFVDKPSGVFEFEIAFNKAFDLKIEDEEELKSEVFNVLWVALGKNFDHAKLYENSSMHIKRVGDIKQLSKEVEAGQFEMAVVESASVEDIDGINTIRRTELSLQSQSLMAIVGVGPISHKRLMLEHGVDHFIDIETLIDGDPRALRFWASGRHH